MVINGNMYKTICAQVAWNAIAMLHFKMKEVKQLKEGEK